MPAYTDGTNTSKTIKKLRSRGWIYGLLTILLLAGFVYFNSMRTHNSFINHDFYRVLYEASNKFNENLRTLERMHKTKENEVSIRSLLPSYQRIKRQTDKAKNNDSFSYTLEGQKISIKGPKFDASLDINDILPKTKQGFAQYLFADHNSNVVASTGGEKTISIVDLSSINNKIKQENQPFSALFSDKGTASDADTPNDKLHAPLPSHSSHVDMQLSYGEFRIFIFPFSLSIQLQVNDTKPAINRLYLVGLLPKQQLENKGSGQWNISLLVVCLVSLLFMWAMVRLVLLPENHSISRFYRSLSQLSSYCFYIVLVALILSYLSKNAVQSHKSNKALRYAEYLSGELKADLNEVFNDLVAYRDFYSQYMQGIKYLSPLNAQLIAEAEVAWAKAEVNKNLPKIPVPIWSIQEMVDKINHSLSYLKGNHNRDCPGNFLPNKMTTRSWSANLRRNYCDPQMSIRYIDSLSIFDSYESEQDQLAVVSFFAGDLEGTFDYQNGVFTTYKNKQWQQESQNKNATISDPQPNNGKNDHEKQSKILTVFATNKQGYSNLPSIYFQESNAKPQAFDLLHRDYFTKVRDYRGWSVDFVKSPDTKGESTTNSDPLKHQFRNVYIQRLLNINDGTRGTTISVPMHQPRLDMQRDDSVLGYVLGADVILPSLSLAPPPPDDFTFMLVDRNTGNVLFHSDEDRSLIENMFFAGSSKSQLAQWIKAGLDQTPEIGGEPLQGFYHGQAGVFTVVPTVIDAWAMVVFYPDDSLNSYMSNLFMYIAVTFLGLLLVMFLVAEFTQHWISGKFIKTHFTLPYQLDNKRILLICTALFTTNYGLFYTIQLLQMSFPKATLNLIFSVFIPLMGVSLLLLLIHRFYLQHFGDFANDDDTKQRFHRGALIFVCGLGLVAFMHFCYLQFSGAMPQKGLQFYYAQHTCNNINKERGELTNMALSRFPNSVTQQRISPYDLLPLYPQWRNQISRDAEPCDKYLSVIEPDDYPKMSTLLGGAYVWRWINAYMLGSEISVRESKEGSSAPKSKAKPAVQGFNEGPPETQYGLIVLSIAALIALLWFWFYFNRQILWPRIYCPAGFLKHIRNLCKSAAKMSHVKPSDKLLIKMDTIKRSGVGIALLLRSQHCNQVGKIPASETEFLPGFERLFSLSPCLQQFSADNTFLPNLKLDLSSNETSGLLAVSIGDIETCLEKVEFRQSLLDMIMELKSLTLSGKLHSVTLYSGFHSFRRVKMKDPLSSMSGSALEHAEYMSWAECLMNFNLQLSDKLTKRLAKKLDKKLFVEEISCVPELSFLDNTQIDGENLSAECDATTEQSFWRQNNNFIPESQWATINYILLHADALYRFKWESCSSAEKLALYNLAKQHRLNPSNTEMIEHLAINGMIKVKDDCLQLINKSFTHFVLHAESPGTLQKLVHEGEAGIWKSYRLPLGMLIVLIIGGIALTSGQSIFIIMASLAGVLGTIGSLASSANLLKGQFKD